MARSLIRWRIALHRDSQVAETHSGRLGVKIEEVYPPLNTYATRMPEERVVNDQHYMG